jgi:recombination protein RecA
MKRTEAARLLKANLKPSDLYAPALHYPTGCLPLDAALGGGWPAGYISQITGPPDVGKTTLLLHTIAAAQKIHDTVYMITFDMNEYITSYWLSCGVDASRLWLVPGWSRTALSEDLFKLGDFIVADGIPGQPEADMIDGLQREDRTIVAVVQTRQRVSNGLVGASGVSTHNLPHKALSVELSAAQRGSDRLQVAATATSYRHWPPSAISRAVWWLEYDHGIDREGALLDMGVQENIVLKLGSHYNYNGHGLGQGRARAVTILRANHDVALCLENDIRHELGLPIPSA